MGSSDTPSRRKTQTTAPGFAPLPAARHDAATPPRPGDPDPRDQDPTQRLADAPTENTNEEPDAVNWGNDGEDDACGSPRGNEAAGDRERRPSDHPAFGHTSGTPLVEIEVVHEHGPAPSTARPWRTVEVWTRNRIYALDAALTCYEVTDRSTRAVVPDHPFLGLRLVGGQHRQGESIELSYPFPRPGTEAVFEQQPGAARRGGGFSRTSAVARVILRLHLVTVSPRRVVPTWEEITGAFAPPATAGDP